MLDYQNKYQKYKKKYDKLKKKFIYKINFTPEYKLLYNTFVNNYIINNNNNNNKIFIENIIDLNYLINEININDNNSNNSLNLNKLDTKLETIKEEDDFLI